MTQCAIHYEDVDTLAVDTKNWFVVNVSKIHGKRHMYTDLQEYIRTHPAPGVYIPDARVVTQEVAHQLAHFIIRNPALGIIVVYDQPDDVPEVLRYFVPLQPPQTKTLHSVHLGHTKHVVESLANAGFLTQERAEKYLTN